MPARSTPALEGLRNSTQSEIVPSVFVTDWLFASTSLMTMPAEAGEFVRINASSRMPNTMSELALPC